MIDKGIPTTGLLPQVLVNKFADHLPLYRQEAIFGRLGVSITRSTLAQWVGSCGVQLQPLVDALKRDILTRSVLHRFMLLSGMLNTCAMKNACECGKTETSPW